MNHYLDPSDQYSTKSPNKQCELSWGLIKHLKCWVSLPDEAMCLPTKVAWSHMSQKTAAPFCCCLLPFPDNSGISHCTGNTEPSVSRKESGVGTAVSRQLSEAGGKVQSENPSLLEQLGENFSYSCHCWHLAPSHSKRGLLGSIWKKRWKHLDPILERIEDFCTCHTFRSSYQPWKMNWNSENLVSQKQSQKWASSPGL